jgi:hypothetical protein
MSSMNCSTCGAPRFSARSEYCTACGARLAVRRSVFYRLIELLKTNPTSSRARPRFNVDGIPMQANGMFDIKGRFYGRMGFPNRMFNVDGTPMGAGGMFDVKGKPYGMRSLTPIHRPYGRKF